MALKTARAWRAYYAEERAALGEAGLARMLDEAEALALAPAGALVFPHTRLVASGRLVAAVARAIVEARAPEVVALGVLHGAREEDAAWVARARAGDADARAQLRKVHDERSPFVAEEFSLDGLRALVDVAARRARTTPPLVIARFPFLVGTRVDDLPGLDELHALVARGVPVVATTDPMHHGVGYGTAAEQLEAREAPTTFAHARARVDAQLEALSRGDLVAFQAHVEACRSDFRDVGPALSAIVPRGRGRVRDLVLVDYAEALGAPPPTWVAGALVEVERGRGRARARARARGAAQIGTDGGRGSA